MNELRVSETLSAPEAQVAGEACPCSRVNLNPGTTITACMACTNYRLDTKDFNGHSPRCSCHGTGKRYPWLWSSCSNRGGAICPIQLGTLKEHEPCNSTGWVLNVDLDGLWRVAVATDITEIVELMMQDVEVGEYALVWFGQLTEPQQRATLANAILRAREE